MGVAEMGGAEMGVAEMGVAQVVDVERPRRPRGRSSQPEPFFGQQNRSSFSAPWFGLKENGRKRKR